MKKCWNYNQVGVLPFRIKDNKIEVLLITSRNKKKWIIPKGLCDQINNPILSASQEAMEEAGVKGVIYENPTSQYSNDKWDGTATVTVFLMKVNSELKNYKEKDERKKKWFSIKKAYEVIENEELKDLIKSSKPVIKTILKWESDFGNN